MYKIIISLIRSKLYFCRGMRLRNALFAACLGGYYFKQPSGYDFVERNLILPVSNLLPPEVAHKCALWAVKLRIPPADTDYKPCILRTTVLGMTFDNPIGLAAGFDKDCDAVAGLKRLGFGFVEFGSVTPLPQEGNEGPRMFKLHEEKGLINRMGFPSKGLTYAADKLYRHYKPGLVSVEIQQKPMGSAGSKKSDNVHIFELDDSNPVSKFVSKMLLEILRPNTCKIGVNLGINKTSRNPTNDYCSGMEKLGKYSHYVVVNVSSPNTPGLRDLQRKTELEKMLKHISGRKRRIQRASKNGACKALLLKISPDLSDEHLAEVVDTVMDPKFGVNGLIVSNTTVSRPESLTAGCKNEKGGLSGAPLRHKSTEMIRKVYKLTNGSMPIVGVGGVSDAQDAYEKIKAGASLVQLYTGLVYGGLGTPRRMKRELVELLERDGYRNVQMAVGADVPGVQNRTMMDMHKLLVPALGDQSGRLPKISNIPSKPAG